MVLPLDILKVMREQIGQPPTSEKILAFQELVEAPLPPLPPPSAQQDIVKLVIGTIFPPAAVVFQFPEEGMEVVKAAPQAAMETAFPITSLFTGQLPYETMIKAETARQISILPAPPEVKEEITQKYEEAWEEAKPSITDISIPEIKFPDILGGLKGMGKYALIAGGLIVAAYLFTRKK